jgi:hypothetical protein
MSRLLNWLTRSAQWGLAALAVLFGGLAVVWFGYSGYIWLQTEPRSVAFGLLSPSPFRCRSRVRLPGATGCVAANAAGLW